MVMLRYEQLVVGGAAASRRLNRAQAWNIQAGLFGAVFSRLRYALPTFAAPSCMQMMAFITNCLRENFQDAAGN